MIFIFEVHLEDGLNASIVVKSVSFSPLVTAVSFEGNLVKPLDREGEDGGINDKFPGGEGKNESRTLSEDEQVVITFICKCSLTKYCIPY
jgi:hypothetical protein